MVWALRYLTCLRFQGWDLWGLGSRTLQVPFKVCLGSEVSYIPGLGLGGRV